MPRPPCCRRVEGTPAASLFKPVGIPTRDIEEVVMTLDEFEAVRLADLDGLYQEQASEKMGISRSTFSRIMDSAHRKVAEALVHGKALRIEGGSVFDATRRRCERCDGEWLGPRGCPRCVGTSPENEENEKNEEKSRVNPPPSRGRGQRRGRHGRHGRVGRHGRRGRQET